MMFSGSIFTREPTRKSRVLSRMATRSS